MTGAPAAFDPQEQAANLLGSLSLLVNDRMRDAIGSASGQADAAAAALSALDQFLDDPSIDLLARVVGLTHSGTVRVVDRLTAAGLMHRRPAADRRSIAVALTPAGRRAARRLGAARLAALRNALAQLSADERVAFGSLAGRILATMIVGKPPIRGTCRLCDLGACGREAGQCPVANAAAG